MDPQTAAFYAAHAAEVAARYSTPGHRPVPGFELAFSPGDRVLDVGAGSGRDLSLLLAQGIDAYGVEPCAGLRQAALARYPELAGRLIAGSLPDLGRPFGGGFDGALCNAVLMHLPREEVFDAAFALRGVLVEGGRLLLTVPRERPGLDAEHRDRDGRLFTPLPEDYLRLLFERLGFEVVQVWHTEDTGGREGYRWCTVLFRLVANLEA